MGLYVTCTDGANGGSCRYMGWEFYEGKTCEELGLDRSRISMLVISELFYGETDAGARLEWVELFNGSKRRVDLAGIQLVCHDAAGGTSVITLDGAIGTCETFVIGGPDSDESNGFPTFDQVVSFDSGHMHSSQAGALVALFMPGKQLGVDSPLSAVALGNVDPDHWDVPECDYDVPHVTEVVPGASIERTAWPAEEWRSNPAPSPNRVYADVRGVAHL